MLFLPGQLREFGDAEGVAEAVGRDYRFSASPQEDVRKRMGTNKFKLLLFSYRLWFYFLIERFPHDPVSPFGLRKALGIQNSCENEGEEELRGTLENQS